MKTITRATKKEIQNGVQDEFGVVYSKNGKKLLKCNNASLVSYTVKDGTKVICDYAFTHFDSELQSVTIPDSVIEIGVGAFFDCASLLQIAIPNSVKHISDKLFMNCFVLLQVSIPDSVESIGEAAFSRCRSLRKIAVPDSVKSIGNWAFAGCSFLIDFTIPASLTSIGTNPFVDNHNFFFIRSNSSRFIVPNGIVYDGLLIDNQENRLIAYTGSNSFCSIPDNVTSIADYAFANASLLEQITIPKSVTEIGEGAFSTCSSLRKIYTTDNSLFVFDDMMLIDVKNKKLLAYFGNETLLWLPDTIEAIGADAFDGNVTLRQIVIPESVTTVDASSFDGAYALRQIVIPEGSAKRFKKMLSQDDWCSLYYLKHAVKEVD